MLLLPIAVAVVFLALVKFYELWGPAMKDYIEDERYCEEWKRVHGEYPF